MKPLFYINKYQIHDDISGKYYFHFLSESILGNQIIIVLKNVHNHVIQKFIHTFTKNHIAEDICIVLPDKKTRQKYYYDVKNKDERHTYYEGSFTFVPCLYDGYISIGFVSGINKNVYDKIKYMKYDVLLQHGLTDKISNQLYKDYMIHNDITQLLSKVRSVMKKKYSNENIGESMRHTWNMQMYGTFDFSTSIYSKLLVNEFMYYMKVAMCPYFITPREFQVNGINHYNYLIGNYNIIMYDNVMAQYYNSERDFISEKFDTCKKNIIVYGGHLLNQNVVYDKLFGLLSGKNIFICNHTYENGKSYAVENRVGKKKIVQMNVSEYDNTTHSNTNTKIYSTFINYIFKYMHIFANIFRKIKKRIINNDINRHSYNYGEYMYDKHYIYSWN
jgi:hypothetical protein